MKEKIVVFGGNGFFGQRFVRLASEQGFQVISVSRRGAPQPTEAWHRAVEWVKGDVFSPEDWRLLFENATAVVDCIGIIHQNPSTNQTYQRFNVEIARILVTEARKQQVPIFVYLSAKPFVPLLLKAYFESKKRAEAIIMDVYPNPLIIRPSLFVGKERRGTRAVAQLTKFAHALGLLKKFQPQPVETAARMVLDEMIQKMKTKEVG